MYLSSGFWAPPPRLTARSAWSGRGLFLSLSCDKGKVLAGWLGRRRSRPSAPSLLRGGDLKVTPEVVDAPWSDHGCKSRAGNGQSLTSEGRLVRREGLGSCRSRTGSADQSSQRQLSRAHGRAKTGPPCSRSQNARRSRHGNVARENPVLLRVSHNRVGMACSPAKKSPRRGSSPLSGRFSLGWCFR
jgi:hypothetical protein